MNRTFHAAIVLGIWYCGMNNHYNHALVNEKNG